MKTVDLKSQQKLMVRPSEPDDAPAIIEYLNLIGGESDFITFGKGEFALTEDQERAYLQKCLDSPNEMHLVGIVEGEIASVLNLNAPQKPRLRHVGEFGVSVRKAYWNQGVAAHMLAYMLEWATANAILKKIMLRVRHDNEAAIFLYKKLGFTFEGRLTKDFFLDGQYYDAIILGKWLDSK